MPYCVNCGKKRPAFLLSSNNLCFTCANEARKQANQQKYIESTREQYKTKPNRTYHVVGIDYYMDAINKVFTVNPESQLKPKQFMSKYPVGSQVPIYKVNESLPAQLVKDPANPYDKNAIKVIVNGEHIGHIDRDTAAKFNTPLDLATSITAKIKSSTYKTVTESMKGKMYVATHGCLAITVTVSFK